MRKLVSFVVLVAFVGGGIWYRSQPSDTYIAPEPEQVQADFQPEKATSTTSIATTTQPATQQQGVDFSDPEVKLEAIGENGDSVAVEVMVGNAKKLERLPENLQTVAMDCGNATDRDMLVRVDSQVTLSSSMQADVTIDYHTTDYRAIFDYSDGLACSEGEAHFELQPGESSQLTFWLVLRGVVTPDHPEGWLEDRTYALGGLSAELPSQQSKTSKLWGRRVVSCDSIGARKGLIWIGGISPAAEAADITYNCRAATTPDAAVVTG